MSCTVSDQTVPREWSTDGSAFWGMSRRSNACRRAARLWRLRRGEIGRLAIVAHQNVDDGRLHERQRGLAVLKGLFSEFCSCYSSAIWTTPPAQMRVAGGKFGVPISVYQIPER